MEIEQTNKNNSLDVADFTFLESFRLEFITPKDLSETARKSQIADQLMAIQKKLPNVELEIGTIEETHIQTPNELPEDLRFQFQPDATFHTCEMRAHLTWKEILKLRRITNPLETLEENFKEKVYSDLSQRVEDYHQRFSKLEAYKAVLPKERLISLPTCAASAALSYFGLQISYYSYIIMGADKTALLSIALANVASLIYTLHAFRDFFSLSDKERSLEINCQVANQEVRPRIVNSD